DALNVGGTGGGAVTLPVQMPSNFTVSFWAKAAAYDQGGTMGPNRNVIMACDRGTNGFRCGFTSAGYLTFWTSQSSGTLYLTNSVAAATNVWNHYAISFQNGSGSIYMNGQLEGTATGTFTPAPAPYDIGIDGGTAGVVWFNGAIGEFRLYTRALAPAEVATLVNPAEDGLVAFWPFN